MEMATRRVRVLMSMRMDGISTISGLVVMEIGLDE